MSALMTHEINTLAIGKSYFGDGLFWWHVWWNHPKIDDGLELKNWMPGEVAMARAEQIGYQEKECW